MGEAPAQQQIGKSDSNSKRVRVSTALGHVFEVHHPEQALGLTTGLVTSVFLPSTLVVELDTVLLPKWLHTQ